MSIACLKFSLFTRRSGRLNSILAGMLAVLFALLILPTAQAQITATFDNASVLNVGTPGGIPLNIPNGVAVDSAGDVYIGDFENNRVVEVTAAGVASALNASSLPGSGGTCPNTGLCSPLGVAADGAGNVYIADTTNNRVVEVTAAGTASVLNTGSLPGTTFGATYNACPSTGLCRPYGVATDSAGDVYIADTYNNRIVKVTAAGTASVMNSFGSLPGTTYGETNYNCPSTGLCYPRDVAIDYEGNVYIADTNNNRIAEVTAADVVSVLNSFSTLSPAGLSEPQGVAVDSMGNVYIADTSNNRVVEVTTAGVVVTLNAGTPGGKSLNYPTKIAVDSAEDVYITDYGNSRVVEVRPPAQNLSQASVGASGTPVTMSYTIDGYSGSSYTPTFQMNYGKEATVGTVTCTGGAAPETCSAPVTLKPAYPGPRTDALKVLDSTSGNALLTETLVYGTGNAPQGVFSPAVSGVVNIGSPGGTALSGSEGVAVDGAGDLYIADSANNRVVEVTAAGVSSVVNVGSPGGTALSSPFGVAVDGAGDLYIADTVNNRVVEVTAAGAASVLNVGSPDGAALNYPTSVAVDGAGDLYIVDFAHDGVVEVTAAGVVSVLNVGSPGGTALNAPQGVAVDAAGDVYIVDQNNNRVVEVTAAGVVSVLNVGSPNGRGLSEPTGVAVDAAGDAYIVDQYNGRVVEVTAAGAASVLNVGLTGGPLSYPSSVAVDGAGDVYITDTGNNRVVEVAQGKASPLSFASANVGSASSDSPQDVTVQNIGNQTLNITALTATTTGQTTSSFNLNGSSTTCTDTTTLAPGTTCGLGVEFQPLVAGALAGSVNITDNNLNAVAPNNVQQISLSGTGIALPTPTVTVTPSASSVTTAQALTVTVALSGGTGNPAPTGTVTLTGGGFTSAATPLTAGTATISIPAGALATGTDTLTVNYSGDSTYSAATGSATVTVTALIGSAVATVTVTPSAPSITDQQTDAVKVSVAGGSGQPTPTGTITLTSGTYSAQQALASGAASFTIPAGALSSGADTLTAAYSGDTTYDTANGTATVTVAQFAIVVPAPPPTSPGASATATVTLSADSTYSGTINLTCTLASSPTGAQSLPTCSLNPASVNIASGGSGSSTLTVKTTAASTIAFVQPFGRNLRRLGGGGTILAALLLFGIPLRRRRWVSMLVVLWIVVIAGAIGCGGGGGSQSPTGPSTPATTAGNYTFTVTGTDTTNAKITTSTNVVVAVQ